MEHGKQALELISQRGPIIPSQISGDLGTNILFTSAILSELVSKHQLKISYLKIGGSPLYYSAGQETKLQNYTKYLNGKQLEAYNILKESKILKDKELTPVVRVALREIKDFARPLEVSVNNSKQIFWKWYLVGKEEAEQLIKQKLGLTKKKEQILPKKEQLAPKPQVQKKLPSTQLKKPVQKTSKFFDSVTSFFESSRIEVIEQNTLKKNTESEFVISFPTPIGKIKYYCIAKNKKRCTDSDLSAAFTKGEMKKLPTLFLTSGEPTKKALNLLSTGLNIIFKKI